MAKTTTPNVEFVIPDENEFYDINVTDDNFKKADTVIAALRTEKVDKISGKGLSTNDLTVTLKENYDVAYTHVSSKSNPHAVTKAQVGLGNVPNVPTNNQTPTFTEAATDTDIVSGETVSLIFGKLLKNIKTLRTALAGKAAAVHKHSTADIASGTLLIANGGTGQTSVAGVKSAFGITELENNWDNIIDADTIAAAEAAGIPLT